MNNCLRRIWSLPRNCHTRILYKHFCNLFCSACNCDNLLVRTVFLSACLSCRNFIGFNYQISVIIVILVREIRDRSLFISGFDSYELNQIICALVT